MLCYSNKIISHQPLFLMKPLPVIMQACFRNRVIILQRLIRLLSMSGLVLLQSCQYNTEAESERTEKAKKRAESASFNIQLGMGYLKQGNMPRAKKKLLLALEAEPDSLEAVGSMAYYNEKTNNLDEAQKYYLKAIALSHNQGAQLNNYGTFLCRTGKYAEAETYFLKAVNDNNYLNTAGAYENAGLCAEAIPDIDKAVTYFSKALDQDPRRSQSLYELATIELKKDNPEKALDYLQKYQELTLTDRILASLAEESARKSGKADLEAFYKMRISKLHPAVDDSGEKNEYDSSNG